MIRLLVLAVAMMAMSSSLSAKEVVEYRCEKWQAKHIHVKKNADEIVKTLKALKCEVKRDAHNGHEDVKYRCPKWGALELKTHEEAHKWEKWLKEYGFETKHKH